jgi:UrcA family protein
MRHLTIATLAAATAVLAGAPALAQPTLDELTVTGHALRNERMSISRAVSFADLDLTRAADRRMLRMRISDTAGDVCEELNEPPPSAANLGRSCQEIARSNAMDQVRVAVANARGAAYAEAAFADQTFFTEAYPAQSAGSHGRQASATAASFTASTVTNGPVADTPENRARYGGPMSHAGKRTAARGN